MKAIIYENYGSYEQLKLEEIEKPNPKEHEVLINVKAASLNTGDLIFLSGKPYIIRAIMSGLFKPKNKILGSDIAGIVEAVGSNVTNFKIGDEVFGDLSMYGFGGLAEYVSVPQSAIALKPRNATFEEAAALPLAASTALQGLVDHANIKPEMNVLINGASGNVGHYMIQLSKIFGNQVTAVCSTRNVDNAKLAGADRVIDYKYNDFTKEDKKYDLIVGANGYQSIFKYKSLLNNHGSYLQSGGSNKQMFEGNAVGPLISLFGDKKMMSYVNKTKAQDLMTISNLFEEKKLISIIDKVYKLEDSKEAFKYFIGKKATGKIVISINS